MILSKAKVIELLKIFENPKSVNPYDNLREKEEMKNASTFINNYHIYGPPKKQTFDDINRNTSLNSKNNSILKNSTFGNNNIDPYQLEIKRSINNLKIGRENYLKQECKTKSLNRNTYKNENYLTYNPYSISSYSSQLQKNRTIFNNILNSKALTSTQYPYSQYGNYTYNSNSTINYRNTYNPKYSSYSKLKEIPSNPEDVEIKELPPNYTISANPISNLSLPMGIPVGMNMNMSQNEQPMISQNLNEPPKLVEEINTDIIQNEEIQQDEEPQIEENQNLQNKEEVEETVEPPQSSGKYQITEFNGPVKLPPGYSTDDEDEFNAIQFLNTDLSTWKKQIDKNNITVYSKLYKIKNDKGKEDDNVMLYTEATIDFPASEVNRQLTYELRQEWEESLKKGKLLNQQNLGNGCKITDYYSYIKMPLIFADRDSVIREKVWEDYQGEKDCCLKQNHSIEHPAYPPKEKPVRAEFENTANYVKPIDGTKCKLYMCSKFNMKLNIPASMMEGKGSEGQEKWVKQFIKQCGK